MTTPRLRSAVFHFRGAAFATTIACLLAGCGRSSDLGSVRGVVTLDGQPLQFAAISFTPESGRGSSANTDAAGRYTLQYTTHQWGARVGRHRVVITSRLPASGGEGEAPVTPGRPELLPPRYHEQTSLSAEVRPGRNTIDFDLTSAPE